jgi:hypothetical protein
MKKVTTVLAGAAVAVLLATPALAQSSAKSSAAQSNGTLVSGSQVVAQLLQTSIKAPNAKELVIDLSVQCGLYTYTRVKGKGGDTDSATAGARVKINIDVTDADGNPVTVHPASAVFCERQQQLSARFGGVIDNLGACTGPSASVDCTLSDEEIALALKTLSANAYNFYVLNLPGSDVYTVTATAVLDSCDNGTVDDNPTSDFFGTCTDGTDPDAGARAFINGSSMYVEEVRFTN